jgi:hypothetical protein
LLAFVFCPRISRVASRGATRGRASHIGHASDMPEINYINRPTTRNIASHRFTQQHNPVFRCRRAQHSLLCCKSISIHTLHNLNTFLILVEDAPQLRLREITRASVHFPFNA